MIRHVLLFRFRPDASEAERSVVLAGLAELPSKHSAIRRFGLGPNISHRDSTFSYAMTMEFETREELEKYLNCESHERFVADIFRPAIDQRAIASYETESEPEGESKSPATNEGKER